MSLVSRWLPTPTLSLVLLVVWLLLVGQLTIGQLALGGLLAVVIPWLTRPLWEPLPRVRHPLRLAHFTVLVLWDIIVANLQVSRLILSPRRHPQPGFVEYPLTLDDRLAITLLANIITMTPGTVSTSLRLDGASLLIHVLDMDDEQALIEAIHTRYERPLKEIFAC